MRDVLHAARTNLADLQRCEQLGLLLGHRALDELATADDDVLALVGNLDDLELVGLPDVGREVAHGRDIDLAAGQKRLDAVDIDDKSSAHGGLDRAGHDAPFRVAVEHLLPADLIVRSLLGETDHARLVVLKVDDLDLEAETGNDLGLVGKLVEPDDAFRLVADVREYVVALDGGNDSCYDGTRDDLFILARGNPGEKLGEDCRLLRRCGRFANSHCFCFVRFVDDRGFQPRLSRLWAKELKLY